MARKRFGLLKTLAFITALGSSGTAHALSSQSYNAFRELQSSHAAYLLAKKSKTVTEKDLKTLIVKARDLADRLERETTKPFSSKDKKKLMELKRDLEAIQHEFEKIDDDSDSTSREMHHIIRYAVDLRARILEALSSKGETTISVRGKIYSIDLKKVQLGHLYGFNGGVYMILSPTKEKVISGDKFFEELRKLNIYPYTETRIVSLGNDYYYCEWVGYSTYRDNPEIPKHMVPASDLAKRLPPLPTK